jgi:hypothetical protein
MRIAACVLALVASFPTLAQSEKCDPTTIDGSVVTIGAPRDGLFGAAFFIAKDRIVTDSDTGNVSLITMAKSRFLMQYKPLNPERPKYTNPKQATGQVVKTHDKTASHRLYEIKLDQEIAHARPLPVRWQVPRIGQSIMAISHFGARPITLLGSIVAPLEWEARDSKVLYFHFDTINGWMYDYTGIGAPILDCGGGVVGVVTGPAPRSSDPNTPKIPGNATGYAIPVRELGDSLRK